MCVMWNVFSSVVYNDDKRIWEKQHVLIVYCCCKGEGVLYM